MILAIAAEIIFKWKSLLCFTYRLLKFEGKIPKTKRICPLVTVSISLTMDDEKKKIITLYSVSLNASSKLHFLPFIFEYKAVILGFPALWKKHFMKVTPLQP